MQPTCYENPSPELNVSIHDGEMDQQLDKCATFTMIHHNWQFAVA